MTASEDNAETSPASSRIASYNIRRAIGLDWRRDGARIVHGLAEIGADIVVLQEADKRLGARPGVLPMEMLSDIAENDILDALKLAVLRGVEVRLLPPKDRGHWINWLAAFA